MKTPLSKLLLVVVLLMGSSLSAGQDRPAGKASDRPPAPADGDPQRIVQSNNAFAFSLYAKLAEQEDGNLFFSPASIHTALTMTYAGAGWRGNTIWQMHRALNLPVRILVSGSPEKYFPSPWPLQRTHPAYKGLLDALTPAEDAGYQLHVANALWGQKGYPWLKEFLKVTQDNYGAGLREVDFAGETEKARKTINVWVEDQTKEKIKDLLKEGIITSDTALVLTNAIYFKGDWASQFDEDATADAPFHISADKTVQVPLMHQKARFGYGEDEDAQFLSMPYKGNELSMVVIVPRKVDGLAEVTGTLTAEMLAARIAKLQQREVDVYLPKFTITSQFSLGETLKSMGMTDAFTAGNADFSGMSKLAIEEELHISAVIHKAFVDVNEEGTEAAAATAVVIDRQMVSVEPPPVFRADHPFLFVIRHNETGTILFIGRVMNPKA